LFPGFRGENGAVAAIVWHLESAKPVAIFLLSRSAAFGKTTDEAARGDKGALEIDRRQPVPRRQADEEIAMQLRQCAAEQGQEIGQGKKSGKILKISKSYARHLAETLRCQKEVPMLITGTADCCHALPQTTRPPTRPSRRRAG
jgi:hypothetical protein